MKKKGFTLLETIVSIMILTIAITILASVIKSYSENVIIRQRKELLTRIAYCVMQEVKYNYSLDEINNLGNLIKIRNHDEILSDLCNDDLLSLPSGDGIEIKIDNVNENKSLINVLVYFIDDKYEFSVEREFIKWR